MTESKKSNHRRLWIGVIAVAILGLGWMTLGGHRPRSLEAIYKGRTLPMNCGHRGASGLAPENTMKAFEAAVKAGAECVELDVMLSSDNKVVVFHDHNLEKRLYAEGVVKKMTWAQLQQVDVSDYFLEHSSIGPVSPGFRPSRMPLLRDVFRFFQQHPKVLINIEIKTNKATGDGLEEALAGLIKEYKLESRVMVSSFNPFALGRFAKVMPSIRRGQIYSQDIAIYLRRLWLAGVSKPDALHPDHSMVDKTYMKWAKKNGFPVHVWTVNQRSDMRRMLELGVQMIITDFPDRLAEETAAFQKRLGKR